MEKYSIEGTVKTPTINFDLIKGELEIHGNSIPENSVDFYKPLIEALDRYAESAKPTTTVTFNMRYFNTSSSKRILDVFKKLENLNRAGNSAVTVNWVYEDDDDDMLEAGEDYESVVDLTFKMVPVKV
ncbi:MAG: DUF1987 domain-containing protein [Bacteroidota bacterium]|nr:DUF1987 domain-containing protein [Bacteroidota bacterium]MDP3147270.1 DUF1987 domain-containing protein [Bacteroidota bacterium]MDP3557356.1 DUF1987 domain-containing protein [Bacteroidota bacterium]